VGKIQTIRGWFEETELVKTTGFEERPNEFVIWVEWRLFDELVKRDCHVVIKRPLDATEGISGGI
jgi:hypothetical protein